MRRGDGVDLLDDDLLEEFLDLGVGLLMLGPGHQAAVIEAMQQVIDRLPAQADAEFLLQDAVQSWQRKVQTPSSGVGPASRRSRNRGTSAAARRGGRPVWGRSWRAARPPWL